MRGVEYVRDICTKKNIAISTLEKDLGFSNGYFNPKKLKKIPYDRAVQIADYLDADLDRILGAERDKDGLTAHDKNDITKDINNIMNKLQSGTDGPASYDGNELDPEAAELFRDEVEIALKRLKIINKEKYTPKKYKREK